MLPGKVYRPEDVVRILRKRIWFLLVPFAVVAAATAVVSRKLPDMYRSDALVLVVPQRVPQNYVKSAVTTRIEDRLQTISAQILSRTRLERVIQDFNLYSQERKNGVMEDVVEKMRSDITIDVVKGDAFRVSYVGHDPRTVMKVTDRLSSLYIDESLRDRQVLAEGTDHFLEAQLEDARRRLEEHEKKLEAYRKQFAGQLPSQLESNLQVIQSTTLQVQQIDESLNRDRDNHLMLDRQLNDLTAAAAAAPAVDQDPGSGGSAAQQLAAARASLAQMELRLTPEHPDIKRARRVIADLEKKADQEALAAPVTPQAAPRKVTPAEIARANKIDDLRGQIEQLDRQIAFKQSEEKRLRGVIASYQQRIDVVPTRESEMTQLTRDYSTLQSGYQSLLEKKEQSKISASLERQQIGEQFQLLDQARLPEKPYSPNRHMINLVGLLGGLGLGLGLIALLEYLDHSFRTDDEVTDVLKVTVLAVVPLMQSDAERRKALRRRIAVGCSLGATVAACLAVVVYTFVA
jgi:polysaccharide chain length determinant protein (PEP-CTERM system associated)